MIGNNWDNKLQDVYDSSWFIEIMEKVKQEYQHNIVYPQYENIFNALKYTDYDEVKVVILGQDPYHEPFQAHGFAFSVQDGIVLPPSLRNIFKELKNDLGIDNNSGDLRKWADEGVLLLNSVLTVEKGIPLSHHKIGWEQFTDKIIEILNNREEPIVFILWGASAKQKKQLITESRHKIIESPHPSPFSANKGFFGSKPFSQTNNFLKQNNKKEVNFKI